MDSIADKLTLKVAAITGIKEAYGPGSSDTAVKVLTNGLPTSPVARVLFDGTESVSSGTWQVIVYLYEVRLYFSAADLGVAYKAMGPFPERFITAWQTDIDLGGTCTASHVLGFDRPEADEVGGNDYLYLPVRINAITGRGRSYAV